MQLPAFGLGTFRLQDQTVVDSVRNAALDRGERLVDPDGLAPAWD